MSDRKIKSAKLVMEWLEQPIGTPFKQRGIEWCLGRAVFDTASIRTLADKGVVTVEYEDVPAKFKAGDWVADSNGGTLCDVTKVYRAKINRVCGQLVDLECGRLGSYVSRRDNSVILATPEPPTCVLIAHGLEIEAFRPWHEGDEAWWHEQGRHVVHHEGPDALDRNGVFVTGPHWILRKVKPVENVASYTEYPILEAGGLLWLRYDSSNFDPRDLERRTNFLGYRFDGCTDLSPLLWGWVWLNKVYEVKVDNSAVWTHAVAARARVAKR